MSVAHMRSTGATTGSQPPQPAAALNKPGGIKAIGIDIALNMAAPYAAYLLLRQAGQPEGRAIVVSAMVPAAVAVASLIQRRRINGLSLLVIGATALSLVASYLSGSAWFALVRPSFITGSIAITFAASLAARRPALFYLARDTMCPTPEQAVEFEAHWERPVFRRAMRRLTMVWAAFLGGEAIFRAVLAAVWPNPNLVAATQVLWVVLPVLLIRWSIKAGRRWGQEAA
jgi:hypothetical protein